MAPMGEYICGAVETISTTRRCPRCLNSDVWKLIISESNQESACRGAPSRICWNLLPNEPPSGALCVASPFHFFVTTTITRARLRTLCPGTSALEGSKLDVPGRHAADGAAHAIDRRVQERVCGEGRPEHAAAHAAYAEQGGVRHTHAHLQLPLFPATMPSLCSAGRHAPPRPRLPVEATHGVHAWQTDACIPFSFGAARSDVSSGVLCPALPAAMALAVGLGPRCGSPCTSSSEKHRSLQRAPPGWLVACDSMRVCCSVLPRCGLSLALFCKYGTAP